MTTASGIAAKAPIGKGVWKHRLIGRGTVQHETDWGEGEFILMRTTFEVDDLEFEAFRISVLARQGFHVYLNGQKINTYIWWKDEPQYRPIPLEPGDVKQLKTGKNVLAIYANAEYDRRIGACFATSGPDDRRHHQSGPGVCQQQAAYQGQADAQGLHTPGSRRSSGVVPTEAITIWAAPRSWRRSARRSAEAMLKMEKAVIPECCGSYRLSILARQGFDVYLNDHRISTYSAVTPGGISATPVNGCSGASIDSRKR